MSNTIKVIGAKIIEAGEKLQVDYDETALVDDKGRTVHHRGTVFDSPPHPDLLKAMGELVPHYAILTMDWDDVIAEKEMEPFIVSGFSIGGKEANGVVIKGHRKGTHGPVTMNTPFTKLTEGDGGYSGKVDLAKIISKLRKEITAFIQGTKVGEDKQGDLFKQSQAELKVKSDQVRGPSDANPEAMGRVANMNQPDEDKTLSKQAKELAKQDKAAKNGQQKTPKRVKQTPDNPSGIEQ